MDFLAGVGVRSINPSTDHSFSEPSILTRRVNNVSGERTYQFIGGRPVHSSESPYPVPQSPMPSPHAAPWAHSMQSPIPPSPGYPAPLVSNHGGGGAMVPYQAAQAAGYATGAPPVTPTGNGGWTHRLQKYYVRPSSDRSWMWRQS